MLNLGLKVSPIAVAGVVAFGVVASFSHPSLAQRESETMSAQSLVGQCRAVNKRTPIYRDRNPVSAVVMLLEPNNAVILNENGGENGMIGVSRPKPGFVHTPNLKMCPDKNQPTPILGVCRRVVQPQGLAIRKTPDPSAATIGGVAQNQKVTLTDPVQSRQGQDGRIWVRIVKPIDGWVSNGFVNQRYRNLGNCS